MIRGNAVIGQSGGPTTVINSSLAGVIDAARRSDAIADVYGMNYGIEGFMNEWLFDLMAQPPEIIHGLRRTPSSALGSSRHKLKDEDFPKILSVLQKYDIRYFFLIGGNDTMDTIHRVEAYCCSQGYELTGVGIPKTVDNDLFGTDHTPGFASAAWSNILNVKQAGMLARDMKQVDQFVIYQTIGRDAGWLAAATAMAKRDEDDAPHLIYAPEHPFVKDEFLAAADQCIRRYGWVSVVAGEGVKYEDGTPVSASVVKDKFSNTEFGAMGGASVAITLHRMLSSEFGIRGEFQVPESLIMSDFVRAVPVDLEEAYRCGIEAVHLAEQGESGYMVTIERKSDNPYEVVYGKVPLSNVAIAAKPMPKEYFNAAGNFVSDAFIKYMKPLTGDIPDFVRLKKIMVLK
ncbi:MAG: diphosphate--fructose-6-phosphate 1-phosphotransferase [Bacteroidales bacterium]|jgi:6-phosphofructokinase 1|nr:diphosphate--fructose-6-phosphate 1-phosphotransferase [Bacteroidales bacterium]